jgi:hypothetical protein
MQFEGRALWVLGFTYVQLKFLNDEIKKESSEANQFFKASQLICVLSNF